MLLSKNKNLKLFYFILLCFISEIIYLSLYFINNQQSFYIIYIVSITICFTLYFININILSKINNSYNTIILIFIFGILYRLTLICLPTFLSNDIYRYIWDGYIQTQGINPYLYSPSALELVNYRNSSIYNSINHPHLPTIYPALAQVLFFLTFLFSKDSIIGTKILLLIFEILTNLVLLKTLNLLNINPTNIAIYALCPLPIVEFFISGHIDGVGIFFLALFIYTVLSKRVTLSAIALSSAVLIKIMPIIFLPITFYHIKRKYLLAFYTVFLTTILLLYLPYLNIGHKVLGSFNTFIKDFYFNSSTFSLIYFFTNQSKISSLICYIFLAIWIIIILLKKKDFIFTIFLFLAGIYIFSPIVHPWYLTWIIPLLIFIPSKAFFWLIMSCQFSYYILIKYTQENVWQESTIIKLIEYLPFFALLIWDLLRFRAIRKNHFQEQLTYVNKTS